MERLYLPSVGRKKDIEAGMAEANRFVPGDAFEITEQLQYADMGTTAVAPLAPLPRGRRGSFY